MWNDKPAVAAAVLISGGTYAARVLNVQWYLWGIPVALCFCASLWVLFESRSAGGRDDLHSVSFSLLLFLSASLYSATAVQLTMPNHISHFLDTPKPLRILCEIADEPRLKDGRTTSLVHVRAIGTGRDSLPTNGDALLTIGTEQAGEREGERIQVWLGYFAGRNYEHADCFPKPGGVQLPRVPRAEQCVRHDPCARVFTGAGSIRRSSEPLLRVHDLPIQAFHSPRDR